MHNSDKNFIPNGWEVKKIGDICDNIGGTSLEEFVSNDSEYKFISIGNYSKFGNYIDNKQRILGNEKTLTKLLNKNDLVMVLNDKTSSGDIIGSTILIDEDNKYIYNQRSERLICRKNILPKYVWFLFNSSFFRKQVFSISQGGTQIYVNFPSVKKIKINIPIDTTEQDGIAGVLGDWDNTLELLDKQIELKSQQKKHLMHTLLTGDVRVPGFTTPWHEIKLGDVFQIKKGSGLSKEKLTPDGINKCILYGELYTTYSEIIKIVKSKTNSEDGIKSVAGDILIPASTTTTGIDLANATAVLENDILLGGDINILRSKTKISPIFFSYYLTHTKKFDLAKLAQGITIVHLYGESIKKIKMLIPDITEQNAIADVLTAADDEINLLKQKRALVSQQKKYLMQNLLTGTIRIPIKKDN